MPPAQHRESDIGKKLARRLKKRRASLLREYNSHELHQLRITLRRMRALLKQQSSKRAGQLRRDLGSLAVATNPARDWDTLLIYAETLLPGSQFAHLEPLLQPARQTAHAQVLEMLQSPGWFAALQAWKHRLAKGNRLAKSAGGDLEVELALAQVAKARDKVLARATERRWHKLRIAIKDLRYRLDEIPKEERSRTQRGQLTLCKTLQEELGLWHDTVVHKLLLAQLELEVQAADSGEVAEALMQLRDILERQSREALAQVRSRLQKPKTIRLFSAPT